jgi:hypothetical protein
MPRLTYAAKQLIKQVTAARDEVEVTNGDPDGLGVIREIKFDKSTSRWLWSKMKDRLDPRIASGQNKGGVLTLVFRTGPTADDKTPFDLGVTQTVTVEPDEKPEDEPAEV